MAAKMDRKETQIQMSEEPFKSFATLYEAVGTAISVWASLEETLATVFAISVGATDLRAAKRAFWAVQAFDTKLKMTNEATAFHLRKRAGLLKEWNRINNRLGQKKNKRNSLAHGSVIKMTSLPWKGCLETTYLLQPSIGTWRDGSIRRDGEQDFFHKNSRSPDAMTLEEITEATAGFMKVRAELLALIEAMVGTSKTPD